MVHDGGVPSVILARFQPLDSDWIVFRRALAWRLQWAASGLPSVRHIL